jgi:cation diffusion facilitator CzcD-associated flavoprotein CzcO
VVVLGSNNSAYDICAALWESDIDVTMVQRSSTHIAPSGSLMELALGGLYREEAVKNGIDHHKAELVAKGSIKLKSHNNIQRINPKSVTLTDGTELPCDVLIDATGYGSMNHWLADLVSPEVADKVGKVWGLGSSTTKDPGP